MSDVIDTDYLVVGAGAAGMAFTDALLAHTDATVAIVDRRHAPGGHWIDAYPFVRLHQPSAFYGVDSVQLGKDALDQSGPNEGFYERAGADELRAYYAQVMQRFLGGGRTRYFPGTEYLGDHAGQHLGASRLTGAQCQFRVRRRLVDTTYLEGGIPATSPPPFELAEGVRCVPAGALARMEQAYERYAVIGAGKTALDTCVWLLSNGVPPEAIRWIKPREGWWLNRRHHQPHAMLPEFYAGVGMQVQALAEAASQDDVFARLEVEGLFLRIDRGVAPTMMTGAILSEFELAQLRRIEDVVRLGYVRRIERDRIVLDEGTVPIGAGTLHVHCAARGLPLRPLRPIYEPGRVTVQPFQWGFASFQFAMLGMVEALVDGDDARNRLCRPIPYWTRRQDYLAAFGAMLANAQAREAYPALAAWARNTRLSALSGLGQYRHEPAVVATGERIKRFGAAAAANIGKLLAQADPMRA